MSTPPERRESKPQAPSCSTFGSLSEPSPAYNQNPSDSSQCSDDPEPVRIGAGSFAEVFIIPGSGGGPPSTIAYKQTYSPQDGAALRFEYDALNVIHERCHDNSFFGVPQPLAFNDPSGDCASTSSQYLPRPVVTQDLLSIFQSPTYAMDRVQAIPPSASATLLALYFPPTIKTGLMLCRLYFGKSFTGPGARASPKKFVNTENFPLDEHRYNALVASSSPGSLPSAEAVARGMGEMLARLHFKASVDARDVEFVLGGDGRGGFTFFVIDFNQVRYWPKTMESIDKLVSAFFANDPYYPRPRPSERLYVTFRESYLAECAKDDVVAVGQAFIDAIEAEQLARDARFATSCTTPPL